MNTSAVGAQDAGKATDAAARKPYAAPTLTVFGDVATLTQSGTGCNQGDNGGCTVQPGSTMGPKN
jgi:aerobic-type carbon monoxide dehydrogenase small subunit (CoxS/CutS family)